MEYFKKLGIIEPILESIKEEGFEKPTEIQEKTIPLILEGRDVIAGSATGSGKTLAFGAGIIQNSEKGKGVQALVLTPTRELAEQVSGALRTFSKNKPLRISAVYGGVPISTQINNLRTADVVVGTPGRLLDHIERKTINLSKVNILVLDEADRMLDMGFIDDVKRIITRCPRQRQTLLFSATISREIASLASKYMSSPVEIAAKSYVDAKKLTQNYYEVPDNLKFSLLVHLIQKEKKGLAMVFCNTRRSVDNVAKNLRSSKIDAEGIHGGLTQSRRTSILKDFHTQDAFTLVCTDVAARGLDIKGVSHIYNYDIPNDSKEYIHRIGRTARAGNEGKAINILAKRDHDNFRRVMSDNDVKITRQEMPNIEPIKIAMNEHPRRFPDRRSSAPRSSSSRPARSRSWR